MQIVVGLSVGRHFLIFQLMKLIVIELREVKRFSEGHRSNKEASDKCKNPAFLDCSIFFPSIF